MLDLIWALTVAALVGIVPGWFWAKLLGAPADLYEHLTYAIALSLALVPALALVPTQLLGSGVTLAVAVTSPLLVFFGGLAAHLRFGPAKSPDSSFVVAPARPGSLTLLMVVVAFTLVLVGDLVSWHMFQLASSCWGWPTQACVLSGGAQRFMLPVALLLLTAGLAHRFTSSREPVTLTDQPDPKSLGRQRSPVAVLGRRLALPVVLLLVLLRGYLGPALHDWPFIRGVDLYSYSVMANLIMSEGKIEPYLIYPPGFHTMTAEVSRLSGLDPLDIFPVLGPALLLLPALSCYVLGSRLWSREYGVVAAFFCGVLVGGTYHYFNDAMYPNLVASQFLLVLAIAALIRLYALPSIRRGFLLAILGSSVVLYHQVSSLYLALLLALLAPCLLPYLLARERRTGLILLGSLALLCALSALYAWNTYDLPRLVGGLLGHSEESPTRAALNMTIGTQVPYVIDYLIVAIVSQPVAWLGLLGAALLAADRRCWASKSRALAYITLLVWVVLLFAASRTSLSGFPQRFGRDLGVPLALLGAFALVNVLRALSVRRKLAIVLLATLAVALVGSLIGLRTAQSFEEASGPSPQLMMTPQIAAAGEWLKENNEGGNIMVSSHRGHVPSRMMLAMGHYSALQSYPAHMINYPRDLPPTGPRPLWDVLWVMNHPADERTRRLLMEYDVRYVVLYKSLPTRPDTYYWKPFKTRPELYRVAFENESVLIVTPRRF